MKRLQGLCSNLDAPQADLLMLLLLLLPWVESS
jgi:hypothetical protein